VKGPPTSAARIIRRSAREGSRLPDDKKPPRSERLRTLLPDIWELVRTRRGALAFGLVLMAVNRVCGLVLPASTKYLIDDVIVKKNVALLNPIVGAVLAATFIQGVSSFTLTQTLSKAAQRLIAEMRLKVQAHVGRLPVAYYDSHKTGQLVSRIMNDVEGVRNLIGTGLVEFLGGLLTSALALVVMLSISPGMTAVTFGSLLVFGTALYYAFKTMRPIFRERSQIYGEVTGRLTETGVQEALQAAPLALSADAMPRDGESVSINGAETTARR
jgi:subfamily B ATP-binding cassette protein MsbA